MTHSFLMLDEDGGAAHACRDRAWPQTYPPLVRRMNQLAADTLRRYGVTVWSEPASLSWNAPSAAFSDLNHHDVCGKHAAMGQGTPCAEVRMRGGNPRSPAHWNRGGLSETITQTLFRHICS